MEDEPDIALVLKVLFEEGHVVSLAADLGQAREAMTRGAGPDLVLLDVMLPDGSGLDLCAELKNTHPSLPVIILTAHGRSGPAGEAQARAYGADAYVSKPFDPDDLLARAAQLLERTDGRAPGRSDA